MITRHRLDAVKKFLTTTSRPIKTISEECSYTDPSYLKVLFKRRFGCTMREWRCQNLGAKLWRRRGTPLRPGP